VLSIKPMLYHPLPAPIGKAVLRTLILFLIITTRHNELVIIFLWEIFSKVFSPYPIIGHNYGIKVGEFPQGCVPLGCS
jgi:hypothetical protein